MPGFLSADVFNNTALRLTAVQGTFALNENGINSIWTVVFGLLKAPGDNRLHPI